MGLLEISAAVLLVDFLTIGLHRIFNLGNSLTKWYAEFGIIAVISDCLVIILGILIAQMMFPTYPLVLSAIAVQIVHDVLFYLLVIRQVPKGQNKVIDLFKEYAAENSWKILAYDSFMIGSTVLLSQQLNLMKKDLVVFTGLLGAYALTYVI